MKDAFTWSQQTNHKTWCVGDILRVGQCLVLAHLFSTRRSCHKLSHITVKQYTKICFWKHLRQEMGNAVTYSSFIFDQDCLVWKFDLSFVRFAVFFCWVLWQLASKSVALLPPAGLSPAHLFRCCHGMCEKVQDGNVPGCSCMCE